MGVDGPAFEDQLASTVVAHRSCRAETNQWLTGRATPKERKRSKNVLLGLVPDDELAGATQAPAAERPSGSGTPPITLRGGQGWSYTSTRSARKAQATHQLNEAPRSMPLRPATPTLRLSYPDSFPDQQNAQLRVSPHPQQPAANASQRGSDGIPRNAQGQVDYAAVEEELGAMLATLPGGRGSGGRVDEDVVARRELRALQVATAQHALQQAANADASDQVTRAILGTVTGKKQAQMAAEARGQIAGADTSTSGSQTLQEAWGAPGASGTQQQQQSPEITTYQMAYHLKQMYPELYDQAVSSTRAAPAPNYTLISEWGDSLKAGEDSEWRQRFFRSLYTATNAQVYPGSDRLRQRAAAKQEDLFFTWMRRQQTYYRELLKAEAHPQLDALLEGVPAERKREALEVLRQLTAVTQPHMLKSHSQAAHCHMTKTEDPELTALVKEQTRVRTMGHPPPKIEGTYPTIEKKMRERELRAAMEAAASGATPVISSYGQTPRSGRQQRPSTAPSNAARKVEVTFSPDQQGGGRGLPPRPSSRQGGVPDRPQTSCGMAAPDQLQSLAGLASRQAEALNGSGGGPRGGGVRPASAAPAVGGTYGTGASTARLGGPPQRKDEKDTFKSKIPLKWAISSNQPVISSYASAFGTLGGAGLGKPRLKSAQSGPVKYREVTCPIGAVNPHTALVPFREAYPVPECYVTSKAFPQVPDGVTMQTTYRSTYEPREEEAVLRSIKAAVEATEAAHATTHRSTLPLGKGGINLLQSKAWVSDYDCNFHTHRIDIAGDLARAAGLKAYLSGPTASAGRLTGQMAPQLNMNGPSLVRPTAS